MFPFIVVGVDVAFNNIVRKGVHQCVSATPLQSYKIFRLRIIIIIIIIIMYVDIVTSNKWLTNADLFAEREGF